MSEGCDRDVIVGGSGLMGCRLWGRFDVVVIY